MDEESTLLVAQNVAFPIALSFLPAHIRDVLSWMTVSKQWLFWMKSVGFQLIVDSSDVCASIGPQICTFLNRVHCTSLTIRGADWLTSDTISQIFDNSTKMDDIDSENGLQRPSSSNEFCSLLRKRAPCAIRHVVFDNCNNIRRLSDLSKLSWDQLLSLSLIDLPISIDPNWISLQLTGIGDNPSNSRKRNTKNRKRRSITDQQNTRSDTDHNQSHNVQIDSNSIEKLQTRINQLKTLRITHHKLHHLPRLSTHPYLHGSYPLLINIASWPSLTSLSIDFWRSCDKIAHPENPELYYERQDAFADNLASLTNLTHLSLYSAYSSNTTTIDGNVNPFIKKRHATTILSSMPRLVHLQLPPIRFDERLEPVLENLKQLQFLKFACVEAKQKTICKLKGCLSKLPNLQSLSFGLSKLCPLDIFPDLQSCSSITALKIDNQTHFDSRNHAAHFCFLLNMTKLSRLELSRFEGLPLNPSIIPQPLCLGAYDIKSKERPLTMNLAHLIERLRSLKKLQLTQIGQLAHWAGDPFAEMSCLQSLELEKVDISLASLQKLTLLQTLKVSFLSARNVRFVMNALENLTLLKVLNFSFHQELTYNNELRFGELINKPLRSLTNLERLELQEDSLQAKDLINLRFLTKLRNLNLRYNPSLDDDLWEHVSQLSNLQKVDISYTSMEIRWAKSIKTRWPRLRSLDISRTFATNAAQTELSKLSLSSFYQRGIEKKSKK